MQLRDLERAIRLLPEEQRQVILLVGLEGMRYEEVAAVLDIPIGTVATRFRAAAKRCVSLMDMKEESDGNLQTVRTDSDPITRARRPDGPTLKSVISSFPEPVTLLVSAKR